MTEKDRILGLLEREQLSAEDASALLSLTATLGQGARPERLHLLELLEVGKLAPREVADLFTALGQASSPAKEAALELASQGQLTASELGELLMTLERTGMNHASEQAQILELFEEEQVNFEEANMLLGALGRDLVPAPPPPVMPAAPRRLARSLRVFIHAKGPGGEKTHLDVSLPLKLSKFSSKFIPDAAMTQLRAQGIDLLELIDSFGGDLLKGPLLDIDNKSEDGTKVQIKVEVL